ncbi:Protein transport protein Sec61 subunit beta [Quillaja saponaria]|uniref:Protein transport protein Sec61 subunit beta n=1 Tax=Quillaja saponaria TaxID=32244 RepID=A0AAD7LS98_QUISA|nr:Protein transport protein Sec61 subunit beta [Quillaja saponaria]
MTWSYSFPYEDPLYINRTNGVSRKSLRFRIVISEKGLIVISAPPRGSAAATASMRRRRTTSGGASGGAAGTMLQFYTDDAPGLKISPNVVLVMSIGFIAFVAVLHVMGKLYLRREA